MLKRKLAGKSWYPYAVALCIAVFFYVLLTHLGVLSSILQTLLSYFSSALIGLVLAYLMNPLLHLLQDRVLKRLRSDRLRRSLALLFTVLIVVAFLLLIFFSVIPQLFSSFRSFMSNLDGYLASVDALLANLGVSPQVFDISDVFDKAADFLKENSGAILNTTVSAGRSVGGFLIAFLISVYVLSEKNALKKGVKKLMRLLLTDNQYRTLGDFVKHSDRVLVRYIAFSIMESLIVAGANMIFMIIMNMSYMPLVSFFVGVTNLVPTFGPLIGAVTGAFILFLVKPIHALWFLIFTIILQTIDGYVIKPKLFGDSLGVSGLWILIAIVVGGKIFGVVGMLVAIPAAAILVNIYGHYFIPWLEKRKGINTEPQPDTESTDNN